MGNPDGKRCHVASKIDDRFTHRGNQFIVLYITLEINDSLAVGEEQRLIDHFISCCYHDDGIAFFSTVLHSHRDSSQILTDFHVHVIGCKIVHYSVLGKRACQGIVHCHCSSVIFYGKE